jgi:hypothetical protein
MYGKTWVMETDLKQRAFDGRWMLMGKVVDEDQAYTYTNEAGTFTINNTKWIILNVYDYLMDFQP